MKINIVPGARYHSEALANSLVAFGYDVALYSSSLRRFYQTLSSTQLHFVPLIGTIQQKLTGVYFEGLEALQCRVFGEIAVRRMRECDVVHGWAGFSLECGRSVKQSGGAYILERSCPHIFFQEELIKNECEKLKIGYRAKSPAWIDRSLAEYEIADSIVVPSRYTYDTFIERGFSPEKLSLTPLDSIVHLPKIQSANDRKEFVVGCLGGAVVRKGFLYLLEAWERLALPNARLLLKVSEKALRRSPVLSGYLDRAKNIECVGYLTDINSFYSRCDVFCLPSADEGFGLAAVEAMANALPVIVSRNVGAADLLQGNEVGFVVAPFESAPIAETIQRLYNDRELVRTMGTAARHLVEERFIRNPAYRKTLKTLYTRLERRFQKSAA